MRREQSPTMKDRRETYGVDVRGKKGRVRLRAKGGLLVKKARESRFMGAFYRFAIAWSSQMCTFLGSPKMALSLGVVRRDEEMGRADLKRGKSSVALIIACLRHNPENHPNGEKSKCV